MSLSNWLASRILAIGDGLERVSNRVRQTPLSYFMTVTGVAALTLVVIIAVVFAGVIASVGPVSAAGSVATAGLDVQLVQAGEPVVRPEYFVGSISISDLTDEYVEKRPQTDKFYMKELEVDRTLTTVASDHSVQLAAQERVSTKGIDGIELTARMQANGVTCERRFTTEDDEYDGNRAGEVFHNPTPKVLVGSYEYGVAEQYPLSNEYLHFPPLPVDNATPGERTPVFSLTGLDPTNDASVYRASADVSGMSPTTPDDYQFFHYNYQDIVSDPDNRAALLNTSYNYYGFSYELGADRTVYYTVVLC